VKYAESKGVLLIAAGNDAENGSVDNFPNPNLKIHIRGQKTGSPSVQAAIHWLKKLLKSYTASFSNYGKKDVFTRPVLLYTSRRQ
jgi:hypothetical protein